MYIGPRVVSLSGDEREVSIVALAGDFIYLANVFSNHLVVLANGLFCSSLAYVFKRVVIPLYWWHLQLLGDEDKVNRPTS